MASLWPWLAVAGLGALHGLNPATGWALAAARGIRSHDGALALRALAPIAAGHAASVVLVAAAVALGLALDRQVLQVAAGGLLIAGCWFTLSGVGRAEPWPGGPGWPGRPAWRSGRSWCPPGTAPV
jgi:hypothetical protein